MHFNLVCSPRTQQDFDPSSLATKTNIKQVSYFEIKDHRKRQNLYCALGLSLQDEKANRTSILEQKP